MVSPKVPPQDSPRAGICRGTESPCGTLRMFRFRNLRSTLNLIRAMALQSSVESSRTFRGPMPKGALRAPLCPPTYPQEMTKEGVAGRWEESRKSLVPSASGASRGGGKSWEGLDRFGSRPSAVHPCRSPLATAGPPGGVHRAEVARPAAGGPRRRSMRAAGEANGHGHLRARRNGDAPLPHWQIRHNCRINLSARSPRIPPYFRLSGPAPRRID